MQAAADASSSGMVAVVGLDVATVDKICKEASEKSGKKVITFIYFLNLNILY